LSLSASDTLFLTWEWCEAWWRNYGNARPLCVLAAWEEGELRGIAPLFQDTERRYGGRWSSLRFIGDGSHDSDYLDCFAQPSREREVISAFAAFLASGQGRDWDELDLHGPLENSPCARAWEEVAGERGWLLSIDSIPCAVLPFQASWDAYLQSLKPRFRSKVRSCMGFFEQSARELPQECKEAQDVRSWLETLFDLHTRRWFTKNQPGVFHNRHKRSFYLDFSRTALQKGWLAFHHLKWGERTLALQYGFVYRNRFLLLQEGYDPDFETLRPGVALRGLLMRQFLEAGLHEYDFLAGFASYKRDWGAGEKTSIRLKMIPPHRMQFAMQEGKLGIAGKELVRKLIPEKVLARRKQLFERRQRRSLDSGVRSSATAFSLRSLAHRGAASLYSLPTMRKVGRSLVARYCVNPTSGKPWYNSIQERQSGPTCQILIFHRINDDRDAFLGATPVAEFRAQIEYLAKNFPMVTLDQVANGDFPLGHPYCVAITFDDGYRDNFLHALPALNEFGVPATIFLATGYIESGDLPWYDQLGLAFKLTMQKCLALHEIGGPECSMEHQSDRLRALEQCSRWLRAVDEPTRVKSQAELFRALRVPATLNLPNMMLSWDEIRRMSKQGISFGAHTVTHPVTATLSKQRLEQEIGCSKRTIEEKLHLPVKHFAYPFGRPQDYSLQAKHVVQQLGFSSAVTTTWGFNSPHDDLFELKRCQPWEADPLIFGLKLDWYRFAGFGEPAEKPRSGATVCDAGAEIAPPVSENP
jgi:CelD/BcsL family acetyltransferase involved in cellulose biosynthesis/peptidoglycan/xylan/chitin deacetylase (PgdA/CDA1 family)